MAKPKLALIPATQGSKLYSVLPADGVGDFNFSRNTGATRINKDGLIETVAVGKSRLNYPLIDGVVNGCPSLLLEPQRTNLVPYSQTFTGWTLTNAVETPNALISPDGALNASKFVTSNSGVDIKYQNIPVTANTVYTYSFYCYYVGGLGLQGRFYDTTNGANIEYYDYMEQIEQGKWKRVTRTFTTPVGCTNIQVWYLASSATFPVTAYYWGAQLEQGSYPTSYIPTSGSAVTRVADDSESVGLQNVVNSSEGVFYFNTKALSSTKDYRISLSDGSANNRVSFSYSPNVNTAYCLVQLGGAQVLYNLSVPLTNQTEYKKFAIKWKSGDLAFWVDGAELISSNGVFTAGTIDRLRFNDASGGIGFKASVKDVRVYSTILTDTDLETITSWTSFTDLANGKLYSIK